MLKVTRTILIILISTNSAQAYYQKFIAENSGTRISRRILTGIFFHNPNPNFIDKANNNYVSKRDDSHIVFLGTPKSTQDQVPISNQRAIEAKEKMIAKKKTQKKIDKELKKQPFAYSTVTIPNWDKREDVSIFLAALSKGGLYKGKKASSKIPVDFNIVNVVGEVVCNSNESMKAIHIAENDMKYIQKIYSFGGFLGDDTIYIKYYDPKCLIGVQTEAIAIEYRTKKGKTIHNRIEMEQFKTAIRKDFNL